MAARDDASLSVVLRGANDMMLAEMERSFHDALCVEQRVMESKSLVVGGGAVETALYLRLQEFALSLATNEQLAVEAFGKREASSRGWIWARARWRTTLSGACWSRR